ncbi:uncharacterized protein KRP23_3981 [Phytophthora ramorum]|uniref:uncharacterized protein n=1 Tax=Phytophthora ramorum TaxID=164328 RepID=UPI0030A1AD45|nr:hypothetical protein KRP23_3981 [Phytophthora ramorum]
MLLSHVDWVVVPLSVTPAIQIGSSGVVARLALRRLDLVAVPLPAWSRTVALRMALTAALLACLEAVLFITDSEAALLEDWLSAAQTPDLAVRQLQTAVLRTDLAMALRMALTAVLLADLEAVLLVADLEAALLEDWLSAAQTPDLAARQLQTAVLRTDLAMALRMALTAVLLADLEAVLLEHWVSAPQTTNAVAIHL